MLITPQESHLISVRAGQGDLAGLAVFVKSLAQREKVTEAEVLISCKDDFQRTAAHIAAQLGQRCKSLEPPTHCQLNIPPPLMLSFCCHDRD